MLSINHDLMMRHLKRVADDFGFDQIVLIARKVGTGPANGEHVSSYGRDKQHCDVAAVMADVIKYRIMGWKPDTVIDWQDKPLPEDPLIKECRPMNGGSHAAYNEASRLVGACHSKGRLIDLVTWLLTAGPVPDGYELNAKRKPVRGETYYFVHCGTWHQAVATGEEPEGCYVFRKVPPSAVLPEGWTLAHRMPRIDEEYIVVFEDQSTFKGIRAELDDSAFMNHFAHAPIAFAFLNP